MRGLGTSGNSYWAWQCGIGAGTLGIIACTPLDCRKPPSLSVQVDLLDRISHLLYDIMHSPRPGSGVPDFFNKRQYAMQEKGDHLCCSIWLSINQNIQCWLVRILPFNVFLNGLHATNLGKIKNTQPEPHLNCFS